MRLMIFKYSNEEGRHKNKGNSMDLKNPILSQKKEPSWKMKYISTS